MPVKVFGIDFTSAPTRRKPITVAEGTLGSDRRLVISVERRLDSFLALKDLLHAPGPWIAGIDFPFGLPEEFIQKMGWPDQWPDYVALVENLGKDVFVQQVTNFRDSQPSGSKHLLRVCDRLAGGQSPLNTTNPPVGKMFCMGAPILLNSGASILPSRPTDSDQTVVEAYPKVVAQNFTGSQSYKGKKDEGRASARQAIYEGITDPALSERYGFSCILPEYNPADDTDGDRIDAMLAAIQAAWAHTEWLAAKAVDFSDIAIREGWIADPAFPLRRAEGESLSLSNLRLPGPSQPDDPYAELRKLSLTERISAIAEDVSSGRDRFRSDDTHGLAELLGVDAVHTGSGWSWRRLFGQALGSQSPGGV